MVVELLSLNTSAQILATDIESSVEFQALLVAAAGKPERSMGESVIAAEPPAWSDVRQRATALLSDPPHLSILVHLVRADTHIDGFDGLMRSLQTLLEKMHTHWESMLPLADPDDPDDPYYERVNYLREIAEDPAFINSLPHLSLVDVRGIGMFSSRDIDIAGGQITATEEEQARCQDGLIRGAFEQADVVSLRSVYDAIEAVVSLSASLSSLIDERAGRHHGLSFKPLNNQLAKCRENFLKYAEQRLAECAVPDAELDVALNDTAHDMPVMGATESQHNESQHNETSFVDRVAVCQAFNQIISFYQHNEPSSPIPVLARRAHDMVSKSFFDVLEDLAPAQKGDFAALLGALGTNPTSTLLSDSYQRFLANDGVADLHVDAGATLTSRADVQAMLSNIEAYFNQYEPSSPVPLVVAEIRRLIPRRFTELIEEFNRVLNPESAVGDE